MIITKLIGGLGNQMFQYGVGRRAALANNTELKLDITGYEKQEGITPRRYTLNIFSIQADIAYDEEINKLKGKNRGLLSLFYKKILKNNSNNYLEGYWQSEKYFKDIEKIIRKEFTFKHKPGVINQKMVDRIKNCNSVSIHIRRGDYIVDKKTNQVHGICDSDYYRRAIEYVTGKIKNPHFFIFSDDPAWAKQNFYPKFPCTYVSHNTGKKDYEDMRLMSLCKHNIIANSSFSWWGTWLNENKNKIVIAPKKWFCDKSIDTKDLIPKDWIKI